MSLSNRFKILILIILLLLLFCLFHQIQCYNIHNQKAKYTQFKVIKNLLSKQECLSIIKEGNVYGDKHGWTTRRHDNYPTTDNMITNKWTSYKVIQEKLKTVIYPELEKMFKLTPYLLRLQEIFIARYDANRAGAQNSLEPHVDGSEFSFIIGLNDNYSGGGTRFIKKNVTVHLNQGDVVIFCGQTRHEGIPVISGTRYILPGFIYYGYCLQQYE